MPAARSGGWGCVRGARNARVSGGGGGAGTLRPGSGGGRPPAPSCGQDACAGPGAGLAGGFGAARGAGRYWRAAHKGERQLPPPWGSRCARRPPSRHPPPPPPAARCSTGCTTAAARPRHRSATAPAGRRLPRCFCAPTWRCPATAPRPSAAGCGGRGTRAGGTGRVSGAGAGTGDFAGVAVAARKLRSMPPGCHQCRARTADAPLSPCGPGRAAPMGGRGRGGVGARGINEESPQPSGAACGGGARAGARGAPGVAAVGGWVSARSSLVVCYHEAHHSQGAV